MEKKQTHIAYGFIAGIITIIVELALYLAGISFKPGVQYIVYVPFLVGILLNAVAYSKANGGSVTFGNVFGSCFKATMIITLVMVAWSVISIYLFPEMKEKAMEIARQAMAKNPQMTEEIMDKSMAWMSKGYATMVVSFTVFFGLFCGAIFSVIGGAVAKKNVVMPA